MNKRGNEDSLLETIVFAIANIIFLGILLVAVSITGDAATLYEETHAKQIALIIDSAKTGTQIQTDISDLIAKARDNNVELIVKLDCTKNRVVVKASRDSRYEFEYFNNLEKCDYKLDIQKRKFIVNV